MRYPQKREVNRKRGGRGSFGSCPAWERANDIPWERRVCLGEQGWGETIQINYKINFIQDSCQRFSLHLKCTFHWLLQVYCTIQKIHISQELAFLWITLLCHETKLLCSFSSKTLYALDKTSPSKCKFSDLRLFALKLTKFLMSIFKPPVNFSLSIASPFRVMTQNSSVIF